MTIEQRLTLITRNTEEILTGEELKELLETKKEPVVYLGYAPTGRLHIGYMIPAMKIKDFIEAGLKVKILLADIHALLDSLKTVPELLNKRAEYYHLALNELYRALGIDINKIEFVRGSDFELKPDYTMDVYRLAAQTTFERCKHAASEVVKFGENPRLSGFLYPILQTLDEEYLAADIQYGGVDQRKILGFAREEHPKIGQKKSVAIMTPMLPGLEGGKMSASDEASKIDLLDDEETIAAKVNKAYACEGSLENNGMMSFMKYVLMVLKEDRGETFLVERPQKFGGNIKYKNYADLERDYLTKTLHPQDLKNALTRELADLLKPVREFFEDKQELIKEAYPEEIKSSSRT